jgi:hypothetical protein
MDQPHLEVGAVYRHIDLVRLNHTIHTSHPPTHTHILSLCPVSFSYTCPCHHTRRGEKKSVVHQAHYHCYSTTLISFLPQKCSPKFGRARGLARRARGWLDHAGTKFRLSPPACLLSRRLPPLRARFCFSHNDTALGPSFPCLASVTVLACGVGPDRPCRMIISCISTLPLCHSLYPSACRVLPLIAMPR